MLLKMCDLSFMVGGFSMNSGFVVLLRMCD